MSEKGLSSPAFRRVITVILLAGISVTFLSVYYFIYLPQQRALFNARTFRILHQIATNFQQRLETFDTVKMVNYLGSTYKDPVIPADELHLLENSNDSDRLTQFDNLLQKSFGNILSQTGSVQVKQQLEDNYVHYNISKGSKDSSGKQLLSEILNPLTAVYSNAFQSVYLIKQVKDSGGNASRYDAVLYRSEGSDIDIANINTDSLFSNKNFQVPAMLKVNIEDIPYRIFLLPFKLPSDPSTFIFAGMMQENVYNEQIQNIPILFLLAVIFIVVALLLVLPFLKIFFLNQEESLLLADVRAVIAAIFIIPFFISMVYAGIWIYRYENKFIDDTLASMQNNIKNSFYNEIKECIRQGTKYDTIINEPHLAFNSGFYKSVLDSVHTGSYNITDVKDLIFHPLIYNNLTTVHWINATGHDIAAWNFKTEPAAYFNLNDRTYFQDIKNNKGDSLDINANMFSIQPVISRLTGEYTINVAMHSHAKIANASSVTKDTAVVTDVSGKMYSVYNTITPKGFSFCIIDSSGLVVCHSDVNRNLQENIFTECLNNEVLVNAVNHKDSMEISNIVLYEHPVKMIVKPLPGLPYYLITYHEQRNGNLFMFHILGFAFICEIILLLLTAFFSYFIMLSNKSIGKLLFQPAKLNWLKPSPDKKYYYIKNIIHLVISVVLIYFFSMWYNENNRYLFKLTAVMFLPLFAVTGYYLIKNSKNFIDERSLNESFFFTRNHLDFLWSSRNILLLYILAVLIFYVIRDALFFRAEENGTIKAGVLFLIIIAPLAASSIATLKLKIKRTPNYLSCFIISLLLTVILISIVPPLTIVGYAFHEEKRLQLQSLQIDLAKKIQQKRQAINDKFSKTKADYTLFSDDSFINDLKFKKNRGTYLLPHDTIVPVAYTPHTQQELSSSPFYEIITRFLFLPPDHDEFYDNSTHNNYYYWEDSIIKNKGDVSTAGKTDSAKSYRKGTDSFLLKLYYNNFGNNTDYKNKSSFFLSVTTPHTFLFKGIWSNHLGLLMIITACIFTIVFYKLIYAASERIFLINFFKKGYDAVNKTERSADSKWLEDIYGIHSLNKINKVLQLEKSEHFSFELLRKRENELVKKGKGIEEFVIQMHLLLADVYERIWQKCTETEKFALYDFAADGFTNYKKVLMLHELYNKGLLVKEQEDETPEDTTLTFVSMSFRNFLITKENEDTVKKLSRQTQHSSWSNFKTIFYLILIAFAIFIFITQQQAAQRLITIITALGALIPAMLKLFDTSTLAAKTESKPQ